MANNFGRSGVWTPQIWSDIDKGVTDQVNQVRVMQQILKANIGSNGPYLSADQFDAHRMKISDQKAKPFMEISIDITLTPSQFDNEPTLHTAQTLAKLAAKSLASVEDSLILNGRNAALPPSVKVINKDSAEDGLLGPGRGHELPVHPLPDGNNAHGVYGPNLVTAVGQGIKQLGSSGPYALVVDLGVYTNAFLPLPGSQVSAADALTSLLKGGFYGTAALSSNTGLLMSLSGDPTTLYVGQSPITAYIQDTPEGSLFRVFERIQFVARDKTAFLNLAFESVKKGLKADESKPLGAVEKPLSKAKSATGQ